MTATPTLSFTADYRSPCQNTAYRIPRSLLDERGYRTVQVAVVGLYYRELDEKALQPHSTADPPVRDHLSKPLAKYMPILFFTEIVEGVLHI